MQVVLDVNVLVSLAIGGRALRPLDDAWEASRFTPVVSRPLLEELTEVLARPYLQRYFAPDHTARFLKRVLVLSAAADPREPFPPAPDPDDAYLLAMLRDSDAELLVTGDKLLLALGAFEDKPILRPADLLRHLQSL